jgi:hypothetical protein
MKLLRPLFCSPLLVCALVFGSQSTGVPTKHFLYVASPGIRNYVEFGGVGILVFDIDAGYKFVKRIPTWDLPPGKEAENVKGVVANAQTARIYLSTPKRVAAFDLLTEKKVWDKEFEGGCDRMALSPDGRTMYVPSFEGPRWLVINAINGDVLKEIVLNSGAHNTVYSPDGQHVYLAGLKSPLCVSPTRRPIRWRKRSVLGDVIRPFTINGARVTLCYVNVNGLLGFEIGDLKTGKKLHRVEVEGVPRGPVKRHGCPAHGIGLTPDEKEIWLCDGHNEMVHVFDNTVTPPRQIKSIKLREQPGWITFSLDGKHAWPSTGEIIEIASKRIVTTLSDETGRQVHSEKIVEIDFANGRPVNAGDQFGLGRKR